LPIHILWLNLITDSLPALALSVDSYDPDLMQKKPYDPKKKIVNGVLVFSVFAGLIAYVASLGIFLLEYKVLGVPLLQAQTMAFTVTVFYLNYCLSSQCVLIGVPLAAGYFQINYYSLPWV
jgi:Ca2+-transporting ATPase